MLIKNIVHRHFKNKHLILPLLFSSSSSSSSLFFFFPLLLPLPFLETSAKANVNIERSFLDLAEAILDKTPGKAAGNAATYRLRWLLLAAA